MRKGRKAAGLIKSEMAELFLTCEEEISNMKAKRSRDTSLFLVLVGADVKIRRRFADGVDRTSNKMLMLSIEQSPLLTADDLVQVIEGGKSHG